MKYLITPLLFVMLFCITPDTQAAFIVKTKQIHTLSLLTNTSTANHNTGHVINSISGDGTSLLPRGRGNGKQSMLAFIFGFMSFFPVLGIPFAVLAYAKGIKNTGRIRKKRGFAIAGIVLATIGIAITILVLSA